MPIVQAIADNWTVYAMMPLVAALIGYVTKLAAVEMMFRPIEFLGIRPYLGWQGVIPRNAARMGAASVDLMLGKLLDPQEIIERIDLEDLMKRLADPMHTVVAEVTRELMNELQPTLWQALPEVVQNQVIGRVEAAVPGMLDTYLADLRANVDVVLDIRMLAIKALIGDKTLLVKMIRTIGSNEMRFIVRVGIPFGFVLGIAQAGAGAATHSPLIIPSFGAVTGFTTDWLALQMIFRPVRPKRYLGIFTWQGLSIKRRDEVWFMPGAPIAKVPADEPTAERSPGVQLFAGVTDVRLLRRVDRDRVDQGVRRVDHHVASSIIDVGLALGGGRGPLLVGALISIRGGYRSIGGYNAALYVVAGLMVFAAIVASLLTRETTGWFRRRDRAVGSAKSIRAPVN